MRRLFCALSLVILLAPATAVSAQGDAEAGLKKAEPCSACHGSAGNSVNDIWPNLAGQKEAYLIKQLRAFRDGVRKDPIMGSFGKPLSDQDIADLAAHFTRLESTSRSDDWYNQRKQQKTY